MSNSSLYNGQNLDFTGNKNPYGLIQNAGTRRKRKGTRRKGTKRKGTKRKGKKSSKKK